MRDRLAFLHLPKSAGTSYRHALAQYFGPEVTVPWSFDHWSFGDHTAIPEVPQPILLDDEVDLRRYSYMEGHFALPTIRRGFDAADVVCVFREPRSRLLSHYSFWRSWGPELRDQWLPYDVPRTARQSIADFCRDDLAAHQADNLIARLIIGPHPLIPVDRPIDAEHWDELAAIGTQRLDELGFVGILEGGAATFDDLEAWCGSPLERVRLNETDSDGGPPLVADELADEEAARLLDQRTAIDRALWTHVATTSGSLSVEAATELADATFERTLLRLDEQARRPHVAPAPADGSSDQAAAVVETRPPAAPSPARRLVALLRRGPRAVWRRLVAEVEGRRARRSAQ